MLGKRDFSQSTMAASRGTSAACSQDTSVSAAPDVDAKVPGSQSYEVCRSSNTGAYLSCYLMVSNLAKNNNKYYII